MTRRRGSLLTLVAFFGVFGMAGEPAAASDSIAVRGPALFFSDWGTFGTGDAQFAGPRGIDVSPAGYEYIADTDNNRIKKVYPSGDLVTQWGSFGTGDGEFDHPCDVVVGPDRHVFVSDQGNDRIQEFTPFGAHVATWGTSGSGPGQLDQPCGLTIAPDGQASTHLYVADTGNDRIQVFTRTGTFVRQFGSSATLDAPLDVAVDGAQFVHVVDAGDEITVLNGDAVQYTYGGTGSGPGQLLHPTAIEIFDQEAPILVVDSGNQRVQRFGSGGTVVAEWGTAGPGPGQFVDPYGVAVNRHGTVYVTDRGAHRMSRWAWPRPDARIQLGRHGTIVGNDRYSLTGTHQVRRAAVAPGHAATFFITLEPDAEMGTPVRLQGAASDEAFVVEYWGGGHEVTDEVVAGTYVTPSVSAFHHQTLKVIVTARPGAPENARIERAVRATAELGPARDTVRFVARTP